MRALHYHVILASLWHAQSFYAANCMKLLKVHTCLLYVITMLCVRMYKGNISKFSVYSQLNG